MPGYTSFRNYFADVLGLSPKDAKLRPLRKGSKVIGGTVLARIGESEGGAAPHMNFAIKPAGRGAPAIDPKPILDGWKLLEATAIYRAAGKNPFAVNLGVGGVLLMSKEALIRRVLADPRIETYSCGRTDIRTGQIDRRVLATLEYLVEKGFRLTLTSLKCGHGFFTASGNVSNHSSGNAVDIAEINGIPVLGNQGPGTLTEALLKSVLQLQGTMVPEELISLQELGGPSFAMADHADHVHIGWQPIYGNSQLDKQFNAMLKPDQWERLINRLGQIDNPEVAAGPSKYARQQRDGAPPRPTRATSARATRVRVIAPKPSSFPSHSSSSRAASGSGTAATWPVPAACHPPPPRTPSAVRCWSCRRSPRRATCAAAAAPATPRPAPRPICR